jgi:hypothetical protein
MYEDDDRKIGFRAGSWSPDIEVQTILAGTVVSEKFCCPRKGFVVDALHAARAEMVSVAHSFPSFYRDWWFPAELTGRRLCERDAFERRDVLPIALCAQDCSRRSLYGSVLTKRGIRQRQDKHITDSQTSKRRLFAHSWAACAANIGTLPWSL